MIAPLLALLVDVPLALRLPHGPDVLDGFRDALRWAAHRSGLPVVVVAAIAVVLSFRLFKHTVRFAIEIAFATVLLFVATRFGWIRW